MSKARRIILFCSLVFMSIVVGMILLRGGEAKKDSPVNNFEEWRRQWEKQR